MDLRGITFLHDLVPGLEFLPIIETLSIFEVRSVQIESGRGSPFSAQCTIDDADHDLEKIYIAYGHPEMYVSPSSSATDAQKQVIPAKDDAEHKTKSQPYHDNEHDQTVYFFDPATRQDVGFTAMNHLLNPPERELQNYHAVDDFDDEDLGVV
ncbi:hypothetical protein P171DRAFT_426887 [Karstenula rhodostoma CBS 690.94]|uniref:Uncharacterized protein n=1 Tax=Karstenula rhodostoma CBS 690.94 TaxID=1392251 RepID=A0A9P4PSH9_9PLEO|nr:hypothetical protein P171DRAFT_426887 [Karstenula rhodostoma CBS 690.94]